MSHGNALELKQPPHRLNRELPHDVVRHPSELEQRTRNHALELAAANQRLRDHELSQALFIGGLAHELRTGINAILSHGDTLSAESGNTLSSDQNEAIGQIKTLGKYLQSLMDNVIDLSRIEAGYVHACPKAFLMADLIQEAIHPISPEAKAKGLAITTDIPHGLTLCSDYKLLRQSLSYCLSNAMKYTQRGKIHIAAAAVGQWVELTVQDTGMGIPAADLIELFQAFSLAESRRGRCLSGADLGLRLTYLLVTKVLGGTVSVKSTPGLGSTFILRVADRILA
jgi:hypothetical protein